jgi:hypothetical protein
LIRDPADPGHEPGRVEEKKGKKKLGVSWQDPVANPLTFIFLLKRHCFDFLKTKN